MARKTQGEMQAIYEADVQIINEQAARKIDKLRGDYKRTEDKHLAAIEKKKIEYDVARQKRKNRNDWLREDEIRRAKDGSPEKINIINRKYDNMNEEAELHFDQDVNAAIEADMRVLDPIEGRMKEAVERVEAWRRREIASELSQLQRGTQRPRKR